MAVNSVTYYEVVCDEPGCKRSTSDLGGDYSAWADSGTALDEWTNCDGVRMEDGRTFCDRHALNRICDSCMEGRETTETDDGERICQSCKEEEDAS